MKPSHTHTHIYFRSVKLNRLPCFGCRADMFNCFPLQMITKNFEDYPEHRLKFFSLLRAIATFCFPALIRLSSQVCVKKNSLFRTVFAKLVPHGFLREIDHNFVGFCLMLHFIILFLVIPMGSPLYSWFSCLFLTATEACHGFHYLGISAHRKEYC